MDWQTARNKLRNRPWAERAAKLRKESFPAGYVQWRPERAKELTELRQTALDAVELVAQNDRLSDTGREERFSSTDGRALLKDLSKIARSIAAKRTEVARRREELLSAKRPKAPDLHATLELGISLLLTANDPARRTAFLNSLGEPGSDGRATRVQEAFLALPPTALDPLAERQQSELRRKIGNAALGAEAQRLDVEEHILDVEENAVHDLRVGIAHLCDPEQLVKEGLLNKPFAMMTSEERVEYTIEHGADALQRLALGDAAFFGDWIFTADPSGPTLDNPAAPAAPSAPPAPTAPAAA